MKGRHHAHRHSDDDTVADTNPLVRASDEPRAQDNPGAGRSPARTTCGPQLVPPTDRPNALRLIGPHVPGTRSRPWHCRPARHSYDLWVMSQPVAISHWHDGLKCAGPIDRLPPAVTARSSLSRPLRRVSFINRSTTSPRQRSTCRQINTVTRGRLKAIRVPRPAQIFEAATTAYGGSPPGGHRRVLANATASNTQAYQ